MNTLTDDELMNLNGGIALILPPRIAAPEIDAAYWLQRDFWAHLYNN